MTTFVIASLKVEEIKVSKMFFILPHYNVTAILCIWIVCSVWPSTEKKSPLGYMLGLIQDHFIIPTFKVEGIKVVSDLA